MKSLIYVIFVILFTGCGPTSEAVYFKSQSALITQYRKAGMLEYNSRFNDKMISFLEKDQPQLISSHTYALIVKVSEKVRKEKPGIGCYQLDWIDSTSNIRGKILLEWHPTDGVIIRFFTTSEASMSRLPDQSF
ncbi:hypothetical protein ATE92_2709 [Ulvibacter sp. MAR_2010_11]|uniref:hypothetical protein n=1 Tax=Ulvibacter sp. MAR_2010_11 TaxID=1250229 RepID=UPI000C2BB58F|nr:hypothetical protein [Ulvibacter sp. MAR_2010_11]PKA84514.1 hypothetical protein ATE92_2709 [Ulvibacter sp. MAR_2010_11]